MSDGRPSLADALFTRTKQRVLDLFFGQPGRSFGTVEVIDLAGSGRGAVQRELKLLADVGLIESEVVGLQKRYRANERSPIFHELRAIIEKTGGIAETLRSVLRPLSNELVAAILYGSVAKDEAVADSDVDVLLVSDKLTLEDAYRAFEPAEGRLGRSINPTLYTQKEFRTRRENKHAFLAKLLAGPHTILIGSLDGDRAAR